ncbi:modification methylase [Salmonella enterica]|nr:modification methylase [Salmonella enterica]
MKSSTPTGQSNCKLQAAAKAKNDEFYTMFSDVEKELRFYREHFRGKTIFLNCDDDTSNFWKFFQLNFEFFGLKKLVATHYETENASYKLEMTGPTSIFETKLSGNGDFRSPESVAIMKEADIVITNPPFSLFREFVAQLVEHGKKFLIVGNKNAITYKEIFPLIKANKLWLGIHLARWYVLPDSAAKWDKLDENGKKLAEAPGLWFTNLEHSQRNEDIVLYKDYTPDEFPTYDNFNAIEVSKSADIPVGYNGVMGVPITFLNKYNPNQFEIIGFDYEVKSGEIEGVAKSEWNGKLDRAYLNNKRMYARILIKAKNHANHA